MFANNIKHKKNIHTELIAWYCVYIMLFYADNNHEFTTIKEAARHVSISFPIEWLKESDQYCSSKSVNIYSYIKSAYVSVVEFTRNWQDLFTASQHSV